MRGVRAASGSWIGNKMSRETLPSCTVQSLITRADKNGILKNWTTLTSHSYDAVLSCSPQNVDDAMA